MPSTTTEAVETVDPVTQAVAELAAAEGALTEVNRRIDSGIDPDVVPDDLLRAETAVRIARARLEVAERQAHAKAEQERRQRLQAVRQEVAQTLKPDQTLAKPRAALEAAIETWVAACAEYDAKRSSLWNELSGLGATPQSGDPASQPAPTQRMIRLAATDAIRKHFPSSQISLDRS